MDEHPFGSWLRPSPNGGWVEPPVGPCPSGHLNFQHHFLPCHCGGHRAVRCNHRGHPTEDDRYYRFHPRVLETCRMDVKPTSPDDSRSFDDPSTLNP